MTIGRDLSEGKNKHTADHTGISEFSVHQHHLTGFSINNVNMKVFRRFTSGQSTVRKEANTHKLEIVSLVIHLNSEASFLDP